MTLRDVKNNFFEMRTTEYQKADLTKITKDPTSTFQNLDDNF